MMRVIVRTCDKYLPALRPFSWLFNKYWSPNQPVVVGGFTPPDFELPTNFSFHSIGSKGDYPVERWSDGLIAFLKAIPDEVFVLMLEDMWMPRHVDVEAVQNLCRYMHQFKRVLKIDLCADRLYTGKATDYGAFHRLDLVLSDRASEYQMSLMPGLWRKELLLRHLVPGETPWQVEKQGTPRVAADKSAIVLGTRQWPVRAMSVFRRGDATKLHLAGLREGDVTKLRKMGYLAPWGMT